MNFIRIAGWSTPRALGVRDGRLVLQVKLSLCRTCGACNERQRYVAERLLTKGISAEWEREGEVVSIPLPPLTTEVEKLAFLSDLLDRPVALIE